MNAQHQKLAKKMSREIQRQFPRLKISGVGPAWGKSADAWIHIKFPSNHLQELKVRDFSTELSMKYFDQHHALILPVSGSMPTNGHH